MEIDKMSGTGNVRFRVLYILDAWDKDVTPQITMFIVIPKPTA